MPFPRSLEQRKAVSTTVFAGIIVVIVAAAAVGAYLTLGSSSRATSSNSSSTAILITSPTTSSSATQQTTSTTPTSSSLSTTSTSSTTSNSSSSTTTSTSSVSFPIVLETNPPTILMAAGSAVTYPLLSLVSLPTAVNGTETVALGVSLPTGFSLTFVPSSVIANTDPHYLGYATMTINSTQNVPPGIYNFTVGAFYGTSYAKTSLRVEVVNYLVVIPNNVDEFTPNNLMVKVGGTVYWFNADLNNPFQVAFSSGSTVQSPTIQPYTSYSYTFTSPGTYAYHDTADPGMTGTITVTP